MKKNKNLVLVFGLIILLALVGLISNSLSNRNSINPQDSSASSFEDLGTAAVCGQNCNFDIDCQSSNACGLQSTCVRNSDGSKNICIPDISCWDKGCNVDSDCTSACGANGVCRATNSNGSRCFYNNDGVLINEIYELVD